MNSFEQRYYPWRQKFSSQGELYHRCREIRSVCRRRAKNLLYSTYISVPSAVGSCRGKRICFLSDWHWHGSDENHEQLRCAAEIIAAERPDVLLLGGDLCEDAASLDSLPRLLSQLGKMAKHVLAVYGNWETGKRWLHENYFARLYEKYNIFPLSGRTYRCEGFRFHGMHDISSLDFSPPEKIIPEQGFTDIVVGHSPDTIIAADKNDALQDIRLAFCGHTHGGQIRMPLFGAFYCPGNYRCKFDRGIFARKNSDMKMIVSSGIGEKRNSRRIFCRREIIITEFI